MTNGELPEKIFVERAITARGTVMGALCSVWRSFLHGAAIYGATLYGSPDLVDFRSNGPRGGQSASRFRSGD
jgi:hypothetical protein